MLEQSKLVVYPSLLITKTLKFLVYMTEILIGTRCILRHYSGLPLIRRTDRGQAVLHWT